MKIGGKSTENYRFYSREKSLYITLGWYRYVESFKSMFRVGVDEYKASFIMKE